MSSRPAPRHLRVDPGRRRTVAVLAAVAGLLATLVIASPAGSAATHRFTVTPVSVQNKVTTPKATSSRLAQSDPSLIASTSSAPTSVVVKLDYDSLSTYDGSINGLPATSPAVTGRKLDTRSKAAAAYGRYVQATEAGFLSRLRSASPSARVGTRLRTVYGGVALRVPARDAKAIAALPGVVAVQRDSLRKPLTDASATFLGAPTLYDQLGATDRDAGKGVIVGVLDTGAWPEHPSFADQGNLSAPPPRADGTARPCNFGDNPLTPAADVFECNDKLIAGAPFLDAYNAGGIPEQYPGSARDGNGHGTHTASTAAGNFVEDAPIFGIQRGPIHGIAPGAWVAAYKVCGTLGCVGSDSAAAVQQAIGDGVSVINFSISGGSNPLTDVVELAFLDAYQAGVFVSASAGNSGPGAATTEHLSPWVTTVAASTQTRAFQSTLTLKDGATTLSLVGSSITEGIATDTPIVKATSLAGYDIGCSTPAPAGSFSGKIVVCERGGIGRVEKGFNVLQGGAAGMILYNPTTQDTETDNHFLPAVHLDGPQGDQLIAFLTAHPAATATFTAGTKGTGQGDVMASFSSRGPGGPTIKPDVTAPGVQILAGNTPTPDDVAAGPEGELFQAIAGTSMSSPHVAGSAALVFALHPDWTPGQVKSALMTSATTNVKKEDTTTPADPFDFGAGRIKLDAVGNPGLTISDSGFRLAALYEDPARAIDMNIPSIDAPIMPGTITTTRVAKNVTDTPLTYRVTTSAPAGARIAVTPSKFTVAPGRSVTLSITIDGSRVEPGQYFGRIDLTQQGGTQNLHLPVAFDRQQGSVSLASRCTNATIRVNRGTARCRATITNASYGNAVVNATSRVTTNLKISSTSGVSRVDSRTVRLAPTNLVGKTPGTPAITTGATPGPGYLDLEDFGVAPEPVGDEDFLNLATDPFIYNGESSATMGISSNGYLVVGGGGATDNSFEPQTLPDPARPNNVLAPFWTDLNGEGAEGIRPAVLTDDTTGESWLVIQWDEFLFGTTTPVGVQAWIGLNGTEDLSYAYSGGMPDPGAAGLTVGAENVDGSGGAQVSPTQALAGDDLRVATSGSKPGGSVTFGVNVRGVRAGEGFIKTWMTTPAVPGTTVSRAFVTVKR